MWSENLSGIFGRFGFVYLFEQNFRNVDPMCMKFGRIKNLLVMYEPNLVRCVRTTTGFRGFAGAILFLCYSMLFQVKNRFSRYAVIEPKTYKITNFRIYIINRIMEGQFQWTVSLICVIGGR